MPKVAKPSPTPFVFADASHRPDQPNVTVIWEPNPGPQTEMLLRDEYQILAGGKKGGGKTAAGIVWLVKGNSDPALRSGTPADITYTNHPCYRALVLRKNYEDMGDWIERAKRIYLPMSAIYGDGEFTFRTGAKIVIGHLAQENAYEKYQGQEFQRILIEELTQIPARKLYFQVRSCCRSVYPELRSQIFLTANPGGRGHAWCKEYFIDPTPKNDKGEYVPTTIYEKVIDPVTGQEKTLTRVFVAASVWDTPQILKDPTYLLNLATLDEEEKEYYLYGNWDYAPGRYFGNFREVHREGEPENAVHVIDATVLRPHWPRWIGGDWGFKHCSAIYWFCQLPNKQVHVYRELVVAQTGSHNLGMEIARLSLSDLDGLENHSMPFYLSPDAFGRDDDVNTDAENMMLGMQRVLGTQAAFIVDDKQGAEYMDRLNRQSAASIGIHRAQNARVTGWQYIRELMQWERLAIGENAEYDQDYAVKLFAEDINRYLEYVRSLQRAKDEVLPILQIHRQKCPRLIKAIPTAVYNSEGKLGLSTEDVLKTDTPEDDMLDALRYGLAAHKSQKIREPFADVFERRMQEVQEMHPHDMDGQMKVMVARKIEADYQQQSVMAPINLSRIASREARKRNWARM